MVKSEKFWSFRIWPVRNIQKCAVLSEAVSEYTHFHSNFTHVNGVTFTMNSEWVSGFAQYMHECVKCLLRMFVILLSSALRRGVMLDVSRVQVSDFPILSFHTDRSAQLLYENVSWHHADIYIITIATNGNTIYVSQNGTCLRLDPQICLSRISLHIISRRFVGTRHRSDLQGRNESRLAQRKRERE